MELNLCAVLFTLRQGAPQVLTIPAGAPPSPPPPPPPRTGDRRSPPPPPPPLPPPQTDLFALPFGPLDPAADATLERGLLGWVRRQTGLELDWIEQLYTFGDRYRDGRELAGAARSVAVAYLAIVDADQRAEGAGARWRDVYELLPWEDRRGARPALIADQVAPALDLWAAAGPDRAARAARRERADIAFGQGASVWDADRVLDRYELLYELGLVAEVHVDQARLEGAGVRPRHLPWLVRTPPDASGASAPPPPLLGRPMLDDHRRILATALGRLRGKLRYRPVVFELLPPSFTLSELQRVVEALTGQGLHVANFRRLVEASGLVEETGQRAATGGRPARRYRFRREVLRERRAPGLGLGRRGPLR